MFDIYDYWYYCLYLYSPIIVNNVKRFSSVFINFSTFIIVLNNSQRFPSFFINHPFSSVFPSIGTFLLQLSLCHSSFIVADFRHFPFDVTANVICHCHYLCCRHQLSFLVNLSFVINCHFRSFCHLSSIVIFGHICNLSLIVIIYVVVDADVNVIYVVIYFVILSVCPQPGFSIPFASPVFGFLCFPFLDGR